MTEDEQLLAEQCRQGDNRARRQLYERYAGHMLGICLRYVGERETARDLLHDGFLKLYASFDKFTWRGTGSLKAWMERVMVNTALQYLRRQDVLRHASELEAVSVADEEPPSPMMVERIPEERLMQFVRELPVGYRTVFNLYVFEEKSHKEIAHLLGINEKSSASQLVRAKSALARKVRQWMAEQEQ
ncbi:MAG: sigma-70 family RNA polymerase sigma factor [Bacteroides sp.]|nr:sigma-70 family RNA polymerase sigma factor [Bacteroides sp.]